MAEADRYCVQAFSGRVFWLDRPSQSRLCITDIAHHLAHINRFTGALRRPVNVAWHSIVVSQELRRLGFGELVQLQGLLHDAHEAYYGDLSTEWKALLDRQTDGWLTTLLEMAQARICGALGVPWPPAGRAAAVIRQLDRRSLMAEKRDQLGSGPVEDRWPDVAPLDRGFACPPNASRSEIAFLSIFRRLKESCR